MTDDPGFHAETLSTYSPTDAEIIAHLRAHLSEIKGSAYFHRFAERILAAEDALRDLRHRAWSIFNPDATLDHTEVAKLNAYLRLTDSAPALAATPKTAERMDSANGPRGAFPVGNDGDAGAEIVVHVDSYGVWTMRPGDERPELRYQLPTREGTP